MIVSRRSFLGAIAAGSAGLVTPRAFAAVRSGDRPALLPRAMAALDSHSSHIRHRDVLGLVDFSAPSGSPRFHIVDIGNGRLLATHLVAHGRGSDPANTGWVTSFSNRPGSNASSRGSFLTSNAYYGKHGRSRRLVGLDAENSNAASRAIVIHSADYVTRQMANVHGRVGRSLGCFTVTDRDIAGVLSRLGEGRLLFAWK
ncbi:MAG: murein L,D-transpeptidase catalytic domain family protein [Novosphingobium sp.]|nr:murein L,D-transpeptidase catalytic domain family protein [Novosphingobium sp.]MCP5401732.1 murein L,D-transpeptidase catalytic domain family protein [Novosphingobium sp.]